MLRRLESALAAIRSVQHSLFVFILVCFVSLLLWCLVSSVWAVEELVVTVLLQQTVRILGESAVAIVLIRIAWEGVDDGGEPVCILLLLFAVSSIMKCYSISCFFIGCFSSIAWYSTLLFPCSSSSLSCLQSFSLLYYRNFCVVNPSCGLYSITYRLQAVAVLYLLSFRSSMLSQSFLQKKSYVWSVVDFNVCIDLLPEVADVIVSRSWAPQATLWGGDTF